VQLPEHFKKPVVHHLHRIFLDLAITHADIDGKAVIFLIERFLAFPFCPDATFDDMFQTGCACQKETGLLCL